MNEKVLAIIIAVDTVMIFWIYIHSLIIKRNVKKLIDAVGEAFSDTCREISYLEKQNPRPPLYQEKMDNLKLCKRLFMTLYRAVHYV